MKVVSTILAVMLLGWVLAGAPLTLFVIKFPGADVPSNVPATGAPAGLKPGKMSEKTRIHGEYKTVSPERIEEFKKQSREKMKQRDEARAAYLNSGNEKVPILKQAQGIYDQLMNDPCNKDLQKQLKDIVIPYAKDWFKIVKSGKNEDHPDSIFYSEIYKIFGDSIMDGFIKKKDLPWSLKMFAQNDTPDDFKMCLED